MRKHILSNFTKGLLVVFAMVSFIAIVVVYDIQKSKDIMTFAEVQTDTDAATDFDVLNFSTGSTNNENYIIVETVKYKDLVPGESYTLTAKMKDAYDPQFILYDTQG